MKPEEWIGKSYESELKLDHKIARDFEVKMGRDGFAIESGDKLAACKHWLFPLQMNSKENSVEIPENSHFFWKSGNVRIENQPYLGDSCSVKTDIRNISEIDSNETSAGFLIELHQLIKSGRKVAIEEQINLILTDNIESHEQVRRIQFEPEWSQEVRSEELDKVQILSGTIFGHSASDLLQTDNDKGGEQSSLAIQGPPAVILLIETFNYHFGSRSIDRISYNAHGFNTEGPIFVAGRDSDAFVTSIVLMNDRRQVLFSSDIRWSYNW